MNISESIYEKEIGFSRSDDNRLIKLPAGRSFEIPQGARHVKIGKLENGYKVGFFGKEKKISETTIAHRDYQNFIFQIETRKPLSQKRKKEHFVISSYNTATAIVDGKILAVPPNIRVVLGREEIKGRTYSRVEMYHLKGDKAFAACNFSDRSYFEVREFLITCSL